MAKRLAIVVGIFNVFLLFLLPIPILGDIAIVLFIGEALTLIIAFSVSLFLATVHYVQYGYFHPTQDIAKAKTQKIGETVRYNDPLLALEILSTRFTKVKNINTTITVPASAKEINTLHP